MNETARPLIEASRGGHLQSIEVLVKAGANVNLKDPLQETALIAAIGEQHIIMSTRIFTVPLLENM